MCLAGAPSVANAVEAADIVSNYADIALAKYEDSLVTAQALQMAVEALVASPSEETMVAAKQAWLDSRVPYQQSEVYRFGNAIVDDWEGRVNAWPLDEGLIDYVDTTSYGDESDENLFYTVNVVANPEISVSGQPINAKMITPELLRSLHEVDEVEANVATGYHAIEFLLWGQDLNGTGPGAGARPWTDFAAGDDCTGGNCERRGEYLTAATALLITDLEEMVAAWQDGGEARNALTGDARGLSVILTGMGSLSYGEQAGERMKLGLILHDPEEEHDCFSDNTHNSHYYDGLGIQNVYLGRYERIDGSVIEGASLADLVAANDSALNDEMVGKLDTTMVTLGAIKETADNGVEAYDQMIAEGNEEGNARVQAAIDALVDQTQTIERIVAALKLEKIEFEGSDSLDDPDAVFQ